MPIESLYRDAVTACIADRGDLTILSYMDLDEDGPWQDACSLSSKGFKQFIYLEGARKM